MRISLLLLGLLGLFCVTACAIFTGYRDDYVRTDASTTVDAGDGGGHGCGGACCVENRPPVLEVGMRYTGGYNPWRIAAGPFGGDGTSDVVATYGSSSSFVFHGRGNGELESGPIISTGDGTIQVSLTDVTSDGIADAIFIAYKSNVVTVAVARSDGTVSETKVTNASCGVSTKPTPISIAARDFDGDGKVDIALANQNEGICILHGKSDGTFDRPRLIPTPSEPWSVDLLDIDADGRMDVVTSLRGGGALIVRNSGTDFDAPTFVPGAQESRGVATGDLDEDGRGDFVLAHETSGNVTVHLAAAGFVGVAYPTPSHADFVAVGDVNGDCHADVLVTYSAGLSESSHALIVFRGAGKEKLLDPDTYPELGTRSAFALTDLDGDGINDIVFARPALVINGPGGIEVVRNRTYR
ncbi:hypothetical protein BH09MYX1_BH09MYX1_03190 [soil metagenome]